MRRVIVIGGMGVLVCLVIISSYLLRDYAVDDAYITFRHAKNLLVGNGFVFNPGDRLLSTTSPLQGLLLASLAFLDPGSLPTIAIALSAASMLLMSVSLFCTFSKLSQIPAGLICLCFVVTQHWFYRFYPMETIMALSLNIAAIAFLLARRWIIAGIFAGFAILARPDSALLAIILVLYIFFIRHRSWRTLIQFTLPLVILCSLWFGFAQVYYGSPLPNTFAAKSGFDPLTFPSAIWPKILSTVISQNRPFSSAIIVVFGILGFAVSIKQRSALLILPAWGILHTIAYTIIGVSYPFSWYYAPLILITIVLSSLGIVAFIQFLLDTFHLSRYQSLVLKVGVGLGLLTLLLFSSTASLSFIRSYRTNYWGGARDRGYREVAHWFVTHTDAKATIALAEVGTIGYFSDRHIIDLLGLVTYEFRDLPKTNSWDDAIELVKPDYIVGVRGLPPDPGLMGIDGYEAAKEFPKDDQTNLFEDIVIYRRNW